MELDFTTAFVDFQTTESKGVLIRSNIKKKLLIEALLQEVLDRFPWAGTLALHHGSLSNGIRNWVEAALWMSVLEDGRQEKPIRAIGLPSVWYRIF